MTLHPAVIDTLQAQGIDPDEWAREHGSPTIAEWRGDACGCTDDRCIGHHHDEHEECGCFPALLEEHFAAEKARGYKTLQWRTTPVRVAVSAESDLEDFGIRDLADEDQIDLDTTTNATEALIHAHTTVEERTRLAAIATELSDPERQSAELYQEAAAIHLAALTRAAEAGDPRHATYRSGERLSHAIDQVWESDVAAYHDAYLTIIRNTLTARGLTTGIEVVALGEGDTGVYDAALAEELRDIALLTTPLPVIGAPQNEHRIPVDALRAAGLSYLERARAALHEKPAPE